MSKSFRLLGNSKGNGQPVLEDFPFSVDTFLPSTAHKLQFVSHAHKDHLINIQQHLSNRAIWCTDLTKVWLSSAVHTDCMIQQFI